MRRGISGPSQRAKGRAVSPCTTYSYELFELAHVLRVRPRASLESQNESASAGRCKGEILILRGGPLANYCYVNSKKNLG